MLEGDSERIGAAVSEVLQKTISFYDYQENYYHRFLAGLLAGMPEYQVLFNRESGTGRPDLVLQ